MTSLPTVKECVDKIESMGYKLYAQHRFSYFFRDTTGKRPLHNREMIWGLREMRDAVRFGA